MRIVVALGGNALLRRGEQLSDENQRSNVRVACAALAPVAREHDLLLSHGNGPQVGLLALQSAAYPDVPPHPLDVLGAQTQGMIGYLVEQELANHLTEEDPVVAVLTVIEVDHDDPAFLRPTKPIGPFYGRAAAEQLEHERGWTFHSDGDALRRVVASPAPVRIVQLRQIQLLLDAGCTVICAGGGGVPAVRGADGDLVGVEAVIDKDHASALLAEQADAEVLVMATDTDAVYLDFGTPDAKAIVSASPADLEQHQHQFAPGSMGPKVAAACRFARRPGRRAVIGALADIDALVAGDGAGTTISSAAPGVVLRAP